MSRNLLSLLGLCTYLINTVAATPLLETEGEDTSNKNKRLYIIIGCSCGGAIMLVAIVLGTIFGVRRYIQTRKRNKVRYEIIDYFRNIKNSEVCRHCWGRQANVYCEDCSQHYFCILCSDYVHNIYRDKRCCSYCRKSLGKHKINNVSWPTEKQEQPSPLSGNTDDPLHSEAIATAQGFTKKSKRGQDPRDINKLNVSINYNDKDPLINKHNAFSYPNPQNYSSSLGPSSSSVVSTDSSYTTLNSLLGYEDEDDY